MGSFRIDIMNTLRRLIGRKFIQDTLVLQISKAFTAGLSALSSLVVWRLLGPTPFGVFALAETFMTLWFQLDLTGAAGAMYTRLGIARGAQDDAAMIDVMAAYGRIGMLVNVGITALVLIFGVPLAAVMQHDPRIGVLAGGLAIAALMDTLYGYLITCFGAARQMRWYSILSFINQLVLTLCLIGAAVLSATPESLVIARLIYSTVTLGVALATYQRIREQSRLPALRAVIARMRTISLRGYWSFGLANGFDKNISVLFVQLPLLIVGNLGGEAAVGFLNLALSGISNAGVLTAAIFENVQSFVPEAVGRGDFVGLQRNILRVIAVLGVGALLVYGGVALLSPIFIPPILGERWIPAVEPLTILALYGAVTSIGGVFGPLYRAFGIMRSALMAKIAALVTVLPIALWVFHAGATAAEGAWIISILYIVSVGLTAAFVLSELFKRGAKPTAIP